MQGAWAADVAFSVVGMSTPYAQRLAASTARISNVTRSILFQRFSGVLDLQGLAGQSHDQSPHRDKGGARLAAWRNHSPSAPSLRLADSCRISRAAEHRALFVERGHRPQQAALSPIRPRFGRSGGKDMTPALIRRLCLRYGLTRTQARLVAALHYGGTHD